MNVTLGGSALHVVYECDIPQPGTAYKECVRAQAAQGANVNLATGQVVARNLLNGTSADPVFTLGPSADAPYYMTATLKIPASGGTSAQSSGSPGLQHQLVFTDGALMRILNVGG